MPIRHRHPIMNNDQDHVLPTTVKEVEMEPLKQHHHLSDEDETVATDEDDLPQHQHFAPLSEYQDSHTLLPRSFHHWLYPPHVPIECQLFRKQNLAVPVCYLLVGLLHGLLGPFTNVFALELGATEAQQVTVHGIRVLPASFKLLFGWISDNFPICGYRRKSYMLLGWSLASLSLVTLLTFSDLHMTPEGPPENAPSIPFLSVCLLGFGVGYWLADVMGDSIVAEKAKLEIEKGHIQSTCYACRFFGLMVAAPFSTYLYSTVGPQAVIRFMAVLPLCILPPLVALAEQPNVAVKPTKQQWMEIWNTVCSRAVWQPMGFVYLYNILQCSNGAWKEFQKTYLGFTSKQLNLILNVAYVLLYFGVLAYKYYFITWSWRSVYVMTTSLNAVFSALQILLIFKITFGLSYFWFALGDDAFAEFISGIQFLPTTIMMVHLCPQGSEGASYAMFTTVNNSALNLSSAISTRLLGIWDVSKQAFLDGKIGGMVNLTVLTTTLQLSGVLFVGLLPRTKEDLAKLDSLSAKSAVGGSIFLGITFLSILYALIVGILNVVKPGWSGES